MTKHLTKIYKNTSQNQEGQESAVPFDECGN